MKLKESYLQLIKDPKKEEYTDIYFFRPFAFAIILLLKKLPLTPNHYSLMALISGLSSAVLILPSFSHHYLAVFFLFLFCVFDCCDGMQARLKKNGSPNGKLIDGIVDYLVNISFYSALIYSMVITNEFPLTIFLFSISACFKLIHSLIYDLFIDSLPIMDSSSKKSMILIYLKIRNSLNLLIPKNKFNNGFRTIGPSTHCLVLMFAITVKFMPLYFIYAILINNLILFSNLKEGGKDAPVIN